MTESWESDSETCSRLAQRVGGVVGYRISFWSRHIERFRGLFVQVVELSRELGLVKLGHLSIDGTKVKANASKHKAMSYKRMLSEARKLLTKKGRQFSLRGQRKASGEWALVTTALNLRRMAVLCRT